MSVQIQPRLSDISGVSSRRTTTRHWTTRVVAGCLTAVTVFLLVAFGVLIRNGQRDGRRALDDRFQTRASLTAGFARDYVNDVAARERDQAGRLLSQPVVSQAAFDQLVASFGFEAAVLLDSNGRLLQVWPAQPQLLGRDMTVDYQHLRTAVAGNVGVSEMVPSAAHQSPITAVAVPFDTPVGRRVISGAFAPATDPLGKYMDNVVPVTGGAGFVIDRSGHVLAGGSHLSLNDTARYAKLVDGIASYTASDGVRMTAAIAPVNGIPWRVVLVAPTSGLHAPVEGSRTWTPYALLGVLAGFAIVSIVLVVRLRAARADAAALSKTDELTGLPNRRAMTEILDRAVAHGRRHGEPLAVGVIDLDHFKSVNDTFGHEVGDEVLRLVAAALDAATRDDDVAGRWGGEEFVVVFTHADRDGALAAADRIRRAVSQIPLPAPMSPRSLTASIGLALAVTSDDGGQLLGRADDALYAAKAAGRDNVMLSPAPSTSTVGPRPVVDRHA